MFWITALCAIAGLLLGLTLFDEGAGWIGLAFGLFAGWSIARQRQLAARITALEARSVAAELAAALAPPPAEAAPEVEPEAPVETVLLAPPPAPIAAAEGMEPPAPESATAALPLPTGPDLADRIRRWFTEGNVPVKVGMLVLFAGVGSLLKYASDEGWLHLPIELRLAGIAAAAIAALAFGFRERHERRTFALSLQGGAIGILALTVFAAFRLYDLLPAGPAFALLVLLVAGAGILAVAQDALSLGVLAVLAGFLAPILVSTGSGNHVALFGWYAILDAVIFAVAWKKAWRLLNLVGFLCTYAVASAWGVLSYESAKFASTEPFLLLFFALYLAIPILFASRRIERGDGLVDGTLVFGNPLAAFALQVLLLGDDLLALALSALVLAVTYVSLAVLLKRRDGLQTLADSFAVVAVCFATITVPLALDATATAGVFAVEGAALIWLGLRQDRLLPKLGGLALQLAGAVAWAIGLLDGAQATVPVANGVFLGGLLLVAGGLASARLLHAAGKRLLASLLFCWALFFWTISLGLEIDDFVGSRYRPDAWLFCTGLTAWLAAEAHRRLRAPLLAFTTGLALWLAVPAIFVMELAHHSPLRGWGAPALAAFLAFGLRSLACVREAGRIAQAAAHLGFLWSVTIAASLSLRALAGSFGLGASWDHLLFVLPLLAAHAVALFRVSWLGSRAGEFRTALLAGQAAVLFLGFWLGLWQTGDASPLPYVPLLNPLDLAAILWLVLTAVWLGDREETRAHRLLLLALFGFALVTAATLRGVHHLGDVPWETALVMHSSAQTSLSVVWSIGGVIGWVAGSRRGNRSLWLAGALLMGLVLAKLAIVDRQHLGNLAGIVSFLAYGVLCTVVGYLAPVPPRREATAPVAPPRGSA